jgi:hypothetical protein
MAAERELVLGGTRPLDGSGATLLMQMPPDDLILLPRLLGPVFRDV